MSTLLLANSLYVMLAAAGGETYADAHRETNETGKPMVVMVGADWCGPCQSMKSEVLPQVRRHGLLRRVSFAVVNVDREPELVQTLTGGGPIPQLVMFRKAADGWKRRKLIGMQSVTQVEQFINEGLALDAGAKQGEAQPEAAAADSPTKAKIQPVSSR